jgi:hypothetical protein
VDGKQPMLIEDNAPKATEAQHAPTRAVQLVVDVISPDLGGWAAFVSDGPPPPDAAIELSVIVGGVRAGRIGRHIHRPDVDAYARYEGTPKGYSLRLAGIELFAVLAGIDLAMRAEALDAATVEQSFVIPETAAPLPCLVAWNDLSIVDAWFGHARQLTLRIEGEGKLASIAFQADPTVPGRALLVPVRSMGEAPLRVLQIDLINPFMPVLLVRLDDDGVIAGADVVPFPSLARGGLHALEAHLGAAVEGSWDEARALSQRLVEAYYRRRAGMESANHAPTIRLMQAGWEGTEPLSDPALLKLLERLDVRVEFETQQAGDQRPATDIDANQRRPLLRLSSDAAPTLGALLEPFCRDQGAERVTAAPFFVSYAGRDNWLVAPAGPAGSQPVAVEMHDRNGGGWIAPGPIAIRVLRPSPHIGRSLAYRQALDSPARASMLADREPLGPASVLIASSDGIEPPLEVLQSLAQQCRFQDGEVVLSVRSVEAHDRALPVMERLFPGRQRIVHHQERVSRSRELQIAASFAAHPNLLVMSGDTVLHDPICLSWLIERRIKGRWDALAPLLIRPHGKDAAFVSGGYFLRGADLNGAANLLFDTPDATAIMDEDYAVAAVALGAIALGRDSLSGLQIREYANRDAVADDLAFGVAMAKSGLRVAVTQGVSATTTRSIIGQRCLPLSLVLPADMSILAGLTTHATGLRRL